MKQNVLITGATGDIGQEIVRTFSQGNYTIYAQGTNQQKLRSLTEKFAVMPIECDFSKLSTEIIEKKFPQNIDILINNAGVCLDNLITNVNEKDFYKTIDINLKAPLFLIKYIASYMIKQRWGRIINISSITAVKGNKGQSIYGATKAGLIGLTKSIALELAPYNITANCIAPGLISSTMTEHIPSHRREALIKQIPAQKLGRPQDIAHTCLFLASNEYINAQTVHVDGGLS